MKITTKGRYGLTIVLELTRCFGQGPISLRSIAEKKRLVGTLLRTTDRPTA